MKHLVLLVVFLSTSILADIQKINYEGFTLWLDCEKRGAIRFRYETGKDFGFHERYNRFFFDEDTPDTCQQKSVKTYSGGLQKYDRGHLVPANHLDHTLLGIKQSNFMTNVLPQAKNMNRGAWLRTEEITECYRDIEDLLVIGGVIWGFNPHDDYFLETHGVKTPDYFWKIIYRKESEKAIAWIIPNSNLATKSKLDKYLSNVTNIEQLIQTKVEIPDELKKANLERSWKLPTGCNRG